MATSSIEGEHVSGVEMPVEHLELDGSFSITKQKLETWPNANVPKPAETLKFREGTEYINQRTKANNANSKIHKTDPASNGKDIHEITPVKYGGSPTDPANKVYLTRKEHSVITTWFKKLQREIKSFGPKK